VLAYLLVLFSTPSVFAEEIDGVHRFYIGGKAGAGLVSVSANAAVQYSAKPGFTAGLIAGWRWTEKLTIQSEAVFSAKGYDASLNGVPSAVSHKNYIEIPLLLTLMVPVSDRVIPYASLGPALGILLFADVDLVDGRHINVTDRTERFDLGLMAGAGVAIDIGASGAICLDARYNHGLLNTNKISASEEPAAMNRAFYVTIGYQTHLSIFSGRR
jgi:hypothetical protein